MAPVGPSRARRLLDVPAYTADRPPSPVVVYMHGGRWMLGDARTHAGMISELAAASAAAFRESQYTALRRPAIRSRWRSRTRY